MTNILKKLIHFQLILLFTFIGISPANAKQQDDTNSINMVYYRESAEQLLSDGIKQFQLESGYKVNLVFVHSNDLKQLLLKGMLNNSLPDIVLAPSDFVALAPTIKLSKLPDSLLTDEFIPEALNSMYYQGNHYGIPIMGGNHLMLFYNKKYVQHPAKNWQELAMQAPNLRAQGIEPIGWNYSEMYWFTGFANTLGGAPLTDGMPSLNTDAYAEALVFYKKLADSGLINSKCGYDCAQKDFQEERFAYAINGEWALDGFEKALAENLGVALIPAIGKQPFRPLFSTVGLIFPNNSLQGKKSKALLALTKFFQSPRFQDNLFDKHRLLPVNQQSFKQVEENTTENIKMLLKQLSQAKPMLADPIMANAWVGMRKGFEQYMHGLLSAKEATDYMQRFTLHDYDKSHDNQ